MAQNTETTASVVLRGRARPQHGAIEKDDFLHWRMEITEPYPHVVHFGIVPGIVPGSGDRPAPFLHEIEEADEVMIEFDLTSRTEGFDGIFPALQTSLDRITVAMPGQRTTDDTEIYGIREKGPNGDAVRFVDLGRLHPENAVHAAYRKAVLNAAGQRRRQSYRVVRLPHKGMLLLMHEVPEEASVPDSAMPFTIRGFASLRAEED